MSNVTAVIALIILFAGVFFIGFCTGRIYNLRKMIAELDELKAGLEHIKELDAQIDADRDTYINMLLAENRVLKQQLDKYKEDSE